MGEMTTSRRTILESMVLALTAIPTLPIVARAQSSTFPGGSVLLTDRGGIVECTEGGVFIQNNQFRELSIEMYRQDSAGRAELHKRLVDMDLNNATIRQIMQRAALEAPDSPFALIYIDVKINAIQQYEAAAILSSNATDAEKLAAFAALNERGNQKLTLYMFGSKAWAESVQEVAERATGK